MAHPALNRFQTGSLDALRTKAAAKSGGVSEAQRVPLDLIDEDPHQPRRTFDVAELEGLAASIRMVGVLQPVGVQAVDGGRYLLRWGARRLRAARFADLADIPAVLVGAAQAGLEAQVIENQHRASNTDSELAAAIATLTERGMTNADIATVLALSDVQSLRYYRALAQVREVPVLASWLDRAPARALYELLRAWDNADDAARTRMGEMLGEMLATCDELTVTKARRLIADLAGAPAPPTTSETGAGPEADALPLSGEHPPRQRPVATAVALSEEERERRVRAWLDLPTPRPPLKV